MALAPAAPYLDFGRRRQHRRHVPHHRREALAPARPAGGGGQQAGRGDRARHGRGRESPARRLHRSEEHTSELQSPCNLVCRLLLEKKKKTTTNATMNYTLSLPILTPYAATTTL